MAHRKSARPRRKSTRSIPPTQQKVDWETIYKKHMQKVTLWGPHYNDPNFDMAAACDAARDAAWQEIAELKERGLLLE
jgi:hypothetical protein